MGRLDCTLAERLVIIVLVAGLRGGRRVTVQATVKGVWLSALYPPHQATCIMFFSRMSNYTPHSLIIWSFGPKKCSVDEIFNIYAHRRILQDEQILSLVQ